MIKGKVNGQKRLIIPIGVQDAYGYFRTREFTLDTGFSGDLALPDYRIKRLALRYERTDFYTLATGEDTPAKIYTATILWHGRQRDVDVMETKRPSLLGFGLLYDNEINIDFLPEGEVTIKESRKGKRANRRRWFGGRT